MIFSRTTLTMAHRQELADLEGIRDRRTRATNEISSGLRVRRPSDGPSEAAQILQTQSELRAEDQFRSNLQGLDERLRAADTSLNQSIDLLLRAQTLASQGSNFNQSAATRASIATEVQGLIEHMTTLANTSFGGKFLFSGLNEDVQPFVPNATSLDGVIYRGDQGQRLIAFPGGARAAVSIDGQSIFLKPQTFTGFGRTAGTTGAATPAPPVGVGITFSNGLSGTLTADLPSFFVASSAPTLPGAGDQITVNFTSTDGTITSSVTATLAGGENATQIASALNAQITASPALAGKVAFSDQGGNLKIVEPETVGAGFNFTASATGGLVTGLESGGTIGGLSPQEIAAALNTRVAADPALTAAKVAFTAAGGEIQISAEVGFSFQVVDFDRGTGFLSGLAGQHFIGGNQSANIFRVLSDLNRALLANDADAIKATLAGLGNAVQHLSDVQGFYGAAERQILSSIDALNQFRSVNLERLSNLQDADIARAATDLSRAQVNEDAALRVAALPQRSLFDFLA